MFVKVIADGLEIGEYMDPEVEPANIPTPIDKTSGDFWRYCGFWWSRNTQIRLEKLERKKIDPQQILRYIPEE